MSLLIVLGALVAHGVPAGAADARGPVPAGESPRLSGAVPVGLRCIVEAYPEQGLRAEGSVLVWPDGTTMRYDDGERKPDHDTLLDTADLEDQMRMRYPVGRSWPIPLPENFEPGRVRHEPFFRKMYGDSRRAVAKTLGEVRWLPGTVDKTLRVPTTNGVDRALQAVSDELDRLPAEVKAIVETTSGTFAWRTIKGTERLSMHSFAVAVDVGVKHSHYWKWSRKGKDGLIPYPKQKIPLEVVEIFEKHGFIWGGKWYHFDTMHFEYRPELLHPACVERSE